MENYLKAPEGKNLLLFVNGYRNNISWNLEEFPKTINKINCGDIHSYWSGVDQEFMERLGVFQAAYADGHHSINTSNHGNQEKFISSMNSSMFSNGPVLLNTIPNPDGFNYRKANGSVAASDLMSRMSNGSITFNKATDTIFVVAHSMGFAYAQGMIQTLRSAGYKITRYYILAPENACSGSVDVGSFEEIWQYGTNEASDPPRCKDGVAPQIAVKDLPPNKRAYIPETEKRDFLNSHYICNYHWIFTKIIDPNTKGYVHKRN
jgi:hypothetical protein